MKKKVDIQLELLKEIDEICSKNNLNYILTGLNSLNAYLNHTLKNGPASVFIAMTQGDINAFCDIVKKEHGNDRYVEGKFNNPDYDKPYIRYGNRNTCEFNIRINDNKINHGISIFIYPIHKTKNSTITKLAYKAYKKSRGMLFKNADYIDKWKDIQKSKYVNLIKKNYKSETFNELQRIEVDGFEFNLPKDTDYYFSKMYGKNYEEKEIKEKIQGPHMLIDTSESYEKIFDEVKDIAMKIRANDAEIESERKNAMEDYETIKSIWDLIQMTSKQVEFKQMLREEGNDFFAYDINDKDEFEELYNNLRPIISTLRKYSKMGMTFSIDPKADELIEHVLMKKDENLLIKIKELKEKEYFIE